jgi:ribonuclease HI
VVLYTDGGCSGNEQRYLARRRMVAVVTADDGCVLVHDQAVGGSNNIAELLAVVAALRWCSDRSVRVVEIRTDSKNNLAWASGRQPGKNINDRARVLALQSEIASYRRHVQFSLTWIPRDQNRAGQFIDARYGL